MPLPSTVAEQLQRVAVGVLERVARDAEADVRLVGVLVVDAHARARRRARARPARARPSPSRRHVAEQLLERRDQVVADHARDADDHALRRVPVARGSR